MGLNRWCRGLWDVKHGLVLLRVSSGDVLFSWWVNFLLGKMCLFGSLSKSNQVYDHIIICPHSFPTSQVVRGFTTCLQAKAAGAASSPLQVRVVTRAQSARFWVPMRVPTDASPRQWQLSSLVRCLEDLEENTTLGVLANLSKRPKKTTSKASNGSI